MTSEDYCYGDFECLFNPFYTSSESGNEEELVEVAASDAGEIANFLKEITRAADEGLPRPETPSSPSPSVSTRTNLHTKRFKHVSNDEIKRFEEARQSDRTKKNTQWGLNIFQEGNRAVYGEFADISTIHVSELVVRLSKFYCEARPKNVEKRSTFLPVQQAEVYHKNTLINIRAAINRHLQDIKQDVDIVRDKEFKQANHTLDGLLKDRMKHGSSRPTIHKQIIPTNHLNDIYTYLQGATESPLILRQCVWYNLAIHFVTRGLEFHHQLRLNSFDFHTDEHGLYASLNHETQQKNYQGGISENEAPSSKRMYATDSSICPVSMLKLLIQKTPPSSEMLFNQYIKGAKPNDSFWFVNKPIAQRTYARFMPDICIAAKVNKYTAHCLRATSIQAMSDSGYEARHIMFMSGHKSESAIRAYNRSCSTAQRKSFSDTLSAVACGIPDMPPADPPAQHRVNHAASTSRSTDSATQDPSLFSAVVPLATAAPLQLQAHSEYHNNNVFLSNVASHSTAGIMTNSVFHGCTINFTR